MPSVRIFVLVLAAGSLAVGGCGGSSTPRSASGSTARSAAPSPATRATAGEEIKLRSGRPLSRAAWIAKGDSICTRANVKLSSTTAKGTQDLARLLPQAAAYEHIEALELSKLVPPSGATGDWQQIVNDLQKYSEFSIRVGEYARVNNLQAAKPIAHAAEETQRALVAIAKRDGFSACATP